MNYRAIIADDESVARLRVMRLLSVFDDIEIIGEASDGIAAKSLIDSQKPELVFMDIEMPGMSGLDVAFSTEHKPFIIFITAFDHYAIGAFKSLAVDYILKPINGDDLKIAIDKFKRLYDPQDIRNNLNALEERIKCQKPKHLRVTAGNTIKLINLDRIICLEAEQKYTNIYTTESTWITEKSLVELENTLPGDTFIRIHRKHIVNVNYISEFLRWYDRKVKIILNVPFDRDLIVSRNYIKKLKSIT